MNLLPDGWLTDEEAEQLAELAWDKTVLELGAWKGRSTILLASVATYLVSVDRHTGIEGHGGDSLDDYLTAVRQHRNVGIVVAWFEDIVPLLGHFDICYIDGDHGRADVERDSWLALGHCDTMAFHDWDFESVREGAAHLGEPAGLVGSLAWFDVR